jgi:hypothetical protein
MDIHTLPVIDLKKLAKERKIKQYYIKKRVELIELLLHTELPLVNVVEKKTIHELRTEAKEKSVSKLYSLSRSQLVEILYPQLTRTSQKKNEDDKGAEKHNDPKNGDAK